MALMRIKRFSCEDPERGATMVEMCIGIGILLFFLLAAAEMLRLSYVSLTLQFAASRAIRQTVLGPPTALPTGLTFLNLIEDNAIAISSNLGVSLNRSSISICPKSNLNCSTNDTGRANEIIVLRISQPTSLFIFGTYTVQSLAVGRNEPF